MSLDPKSNNQNDSDEHNQGDIQKTSPYTNLRLVCSQNLKRGLATLQLITAFTFSLPSCLLQLVLIEEAANLSCFGIIRYFLWASVMKMKELTTKPCKIDQNPATKTLFENNNAIGTRLANFLAPLDVQVWLYWVFQSSNFGGQSFLAIQQAFPSCTSQPILNRDCANSKHCSLGSSDLEAVRAC